VGQLTEVEQGEWASVAEPSSAGPPRLVDHVSPLLVNVLTALGFGLPVLGYFWAIARYSVNDIYQDQWSDITVIQHSYSNLFDWGSLWSQHNEDRIFFPNLVVIGLAHATHFNIRAEEFVSGAMLVVATALVIWAHKRRSPRTPWLYYCPVAILACSLVQYGATLWGFQLAWYLVLLALASAVALIDRVTLTWPILVFAAAAAVIGSFSSLQGLLIWPVGLVLLFCRRRRVRFALAWLGAAALTAALYLYNFNFQAGTVFPSSLTRHAISPLLFATFAVGDVVGTPVKFGGQENAVLVLGVVIVVLAVAVLAVYGIRGDNRSGSPVGVALICFGLLFAGLVAEGRAGLGYWVASSSGYTIYELMVLIGMYLAVLGRPWPRAGGVAQDGGLPGDGRRQRTSRWQGGYQWIERSVPRVTAWALVGIIALQLILGIGNGLDGARTVHAAQLQAEYTALHIDQASDADVLDHLNFSESAAFTRRQARIAEAHDLGPYATADNRDRP
jgi:hypothetical protein